MDLAQAILVALEKAVPPGKSAWSVEPVPITECAPEAKTCEHAWLSKFYGGWVRLESKEHARSRYTKAAKRIALLVRDMPDPAYAAGKIVGIGVNESGFREDVQMGRVSSKEETKLGLRGAGRGPSGEVCFMQILPSMAKKYGPLESFLGESDEALDRCFRAAFDQLEDSRKRCSPSKRKIPGAPAGYAPVTELYAMVSRYGNGSSCTSSNAGKTEARVQTITWVTVVIRQSLRS